MDANEEIFCVFAVLNASGYDTGVGVNTGDDTRDEVRALLAKRSVPSLAELQTFYNEHRIASDAGAELGQYVSLALLLGPPPDFKVTVPEVNLPPDAKAVVGLVPLMKQFYREANLQDLWARLQGRYQEEVARYSPSVRQAVTLSDAYFRFASGAYLGRTMTIDLDLLGAPGQAQARIYGLNYYLVVTPSKDLRIDEIRHQYLHFLLDPLAAKYAAEIHQKEQLRALAYHAPMLAIDFREDFSLLLTECLIRAAELRLDKRPKAAAEKSMGEMAAAGLILVPYFYSALQDYERQDATMTVYYRSMVLGLDIGEETRRLASVKFARKPEARGNTLAPAETEEERLLGQGDNFLYQGKYNEAKAAYLAVLEHQNPKSERALFGLAVIAGNQRKPDLAEDYFLKTLSAARDVRLVTWSHIYLGRLYDLEGKREQALEQYRAASLTAAGYPGALHAVQAGLAKPYGSKE